jgi:hypothetical protein
MRIEPNGITWYKPRLEFICDPICIVDLDPSLFIKWICKTYYS